MTIDVAGLTIPQLKNVVENHRRKGATSATLTSTPCANWRRAREAVSTSTSRLR